MLMETQVTQELYREVTGQKPRKFRGDQLPVEQVSNRFHGKMVLHFVTPYRRGFIV